ncbi:MFS transporter [Oryzihumus leptocrescens]|uniref:EmrB/QacA subfamily drug resistance transporter n=1 Tax=Oryzihumus leptocrescens TaxID=297536 RepID=A0A542ZLP6_9MICO|nr:MFS transporter [Oryzihumus leptocrescens]TQL61199.1 EmrB/QacA subfamily drug resistance transporter [Oryzihumus leptocrescens]
MPGSTYPSRPVRWWIFATVLVADVLDLLSTTVTNIAAPSIVRDLSAPASLTPWLGASYALALGSSLVLGARLGDRYGTRRLFLLGVAGFALASLACALATGAVGIVIARIAQGAFGALLIPQGFSILLRTFPRDELGAVFGVFGPLLGVSAISGPVLAALLIRANPFDLGWRSIFVVNVVLGVGLFACAARLLPRQAGNRDVVLAPAASMLLMGGLGALLGGLISGSGGTWSTRAVALVALGFVLLLAFVRHQVRSRNPLLTPSLFRHVSFVAGLVVGSVFFAATAGLLYVTSLYLQDGLGLAALPTAAVMAPMSLGIIIASFSVRSSIERLGRRLVTAGLALVGLGVLAYTASVHYAPHSLWLLVCPLFVCGLGMGCCFGSLFAVALGEVSEEQAGSASGTLNAVQQLASSVGAALISTTYLAGTSATGSGHAVIRSLLVVLAVIAACFTCLPLLPRRAAAEAH